MAPLSGAVVSDNTFISFRSFFCVRFRYVVQNTETSLFQGPNPPQATERINRLRISTSARTNVKKIERKMKLIAPQDKVIFVNGLWKGFKAFWDDCILCFFFLILIHQMILNAEYTIGFHYYNKYDVIDFGIVCFFVQMYCKMHVRLFYPCANLWIKLQIKFDKLIPTLLQNLISQFF